MSKRIELFLSNYNLQKKKRIHFLNIETRQTLLLIVLLLKLFIDIKIQKMLVLQILICY